MCHSAWLCHCGREKGRIRQSRQPTKAELGRASKVQSEQSPGDSRVGGSGIGHLLCTAQFLLIFSSTSIIAFLIAPTYRFLLNKKTLLDQCLHEVDVFEHTSKVTKFETHYQEDIYPISYLIFRVIYVLLG